jgi:predicted ATP-dependent endonuclease of OLD family
MKISNLRLSGVGGIENLSMSFDPEMNIICGPNGIGKTTIIESIAHCFAAGETSILKRNVRSTRSEIIAEVVHEGQSIPVAIGFDQFEPSVRAQINGRHELSPYLLSLKTTRTFAYTPLNSINRDTEKAIHVLFEEAKAGVSLNDLKNWFVNRYLYSAHPGALSEAQVANFDLAKRCFSELNPEFTFARVSASSNEILVATPSGEIYYEYLSSGFKSCLSILFGIIKEVEFRFPGRSINAEAFDGIVLIDEIEMHLHPAWQSKISKVLTRIFPSVQFIVTTHSPHVIQSAEPNQILALENRDDLVALRALPSSKYGFKGWTLDEVLTDVMGMSDTRTDEFRVLMSAFTDAVDADDQRLAIEAYEQLDASLHPASHIRKLLKLQLSSLTPFNDDQA